MIKFGAEIIKKYGINVSKGTIVVSEGDNTREMYIVHKGELEAIRSVGEHERVMRHIKEGDFFGELSLLNNEPRSATVKATEAAVLLKISPESFETLVKKSPDLSLKIIKALAERLCKSNEEIAGLQEQEEDMKLLKSVISKIKSIGNKGVKGIKVDATLESIAEEIKSPKEALQLVKFDLENAKNVITFLEDGTFEIKEMDLLMEFIDFIELRKQVLRDEASESDLKSILKV